MFIDRTTKPEPGVGLRKGHWSTDGIVAHWPFYMRGGLIARDLSGKGNHGVLLNDPEWMAGALYFDPTNNQVVDCGGDSSLDLPSAGTMSFLFKKDSVQPYLYPYVISTDGDNGLFAYSMGGSIDFSTMRLALDNNLGANVVDIGAAITNDKWQHWTGVWTGTQAFLYRDGVEVASDLAYTGPIDGVTNLFIGKLKSYERYVAGFIDHVTLRNRDLSASEVKQLAINPHLVYEPEWLPDIVAAPAAGMPMFKVNSGLVNAGLTSGGLVG